MRHDSTFGRLDPLVKDQVDEMLLSGLKLEDVQNFLAGKDIRVSLTSISQYYRTHLLPLKIARLNRTAAELNKMKVDGLTEATLQTLRSTVLDLAAQPAPDAKTLATLMSLVLKAEAQALDERRLALAEAKAKAADKAKEITESDLTPEEKERKMKAIFGVY